MIEDVHVRAHTLKVIIDCKNNARCVLELFDVALGVLVYMCTYDANDKRRARTRDHTHEYVRTRDHTHEYGRRSGDTAGDLHFKPQPIDVLQTIRLMSNVHPHACRSQP